MPTKTTKKVTTLCQRPATRKRKPTPPIIDDTTYNDYRQCIHVFGIKVATVCQELIDTIDQITGYWPLGERNDKLGAIRHVMDKTSCFSRNLTISAITGNHDIPAEDRIDF